MSEQRVLAFPETRHSSLCWTQQNKFPLSRSIPGSHAGCLSIMPKPQGRLP